MSNKFLHFIVFFLIVLAVFLAGYLFSYKSDPADQQALINNSLVTRFNKTEEQNIAPIGLFELTSSEASFPYLLATSEVLYYTPKNGEIRSISIRNPIAGSTLVAKISPNASYISWAVNKTLVASYSTGSIFYDLTSNFSKKYANNIKNPVLSKTGTKIAYIYFNNETGEGNINIADPKLESQKNILATRFANWQISWLEDDQLALIKPPTLQNTASSFYVLSVENAALQNVLDLKNNLEVTWSGNGQKLVYSYTDLATQEKGLYFMDLADKVELALNSTLSASRCVWSIDNKTVYCADKNSFVSFDTSLPQTKPKETVIPNASGAVADVTHLMLNSIEDYLIFKNSKDGKLYGFGLK